MARPRPRDREEFLDLVARSVALHRPWVHAPADAEAYDRYVRNARRPGFLPFLIRRVDTGEIAGVVNASEIVRGIFRSTYLGFYAFAPSAGRGYMTEGLGLVLGELFGPERLHRAEANIQPGNAASKALVKRLGFRREGFSPRYLKIGGRWRDHERWALLAEDWRPSRARPRPARSGKGKPA
jgi:ribosomal-protein-alanine N-acetyltransferase